LGSEDALLPFLEIGHESGNERQISASSTQNISDASTVFLEHLRNSFHNRIPIPPKDLSIYPKIFSESGMEAFRQLQKDPLRAQKETEKMNSEEEKAKRLDNFKDAKKEVINDTLTPIKDAIEAIKQGMVTKDDLNEYSKKTDLDNFSKTITDSITNFQKSVLKKEDLGHLATVEGLATLSNSVLKKEGFKGLATSKDIEGLAKNESI
jgi:hypothetical protein